MGVIENFKKLVGRYKKARDFFNNTPGDKSSYLPELYKVIDEIDSTAGELIQNGTMTFDEVIEALK